MFPVIGLVVLLLMAFGGFAITGGALEPVLEGSGIDPARLRAAVDLLTGLADAARRDDAVPASAR